MRIVSWPGPEAGHNAFVPTFLDALARQGAEIVAAPVVDAIDPRGADIILLHWLERVFWEAQGRADLLRRMIALLSRVGRRPAGCRVVWVTHNLAPHERQRFKRLLWPPYAAVAARLIDGFLTLSPGTVEPVRRETPGLRDKPGDHVLHPAYAVAPEAAAAGAALRREFGWSDDCVVVGYCGQVRPYKNVDALIDAFRGLDDPRARLLVAGLPQDARYAERLRARLTDEPRARLALADLDRAAFDAHLCACDQIAAPFTDYLHSGSIVHALSAGRPVLAARTPFADSLADAVGAAWLRRYEDRLDAAALSAALADRPTGAPDLGALDPNAGARRAMAFFQRLRAGATAP